MTDVFSSVAVSIALLVVPCTHSASAQAIATNDPPQYVPFNAVRNGASRPRLCSVASNE
jgi:hypothetical protein